MGKVSVELTASHDDTWFGDDNALVQSELALYHRAVLRRAGPTLDDAQIKKILHNAGNLGVEPGQLILSALLAHKQGGADRPFYASALTGPSAIRHLTTYREECVTRYGTFDMRAMGDVAKLPKEHNVYVRLCDSESVAAPHGVNEATRCRSIESLYEMRELALDAWRMVVPKRVAAAYDALTARRT